MSDHEMSVVPFWTLSTNDRAEVPAAALDASLTPGRLAELRSALAAFSSAPLVTLEAHPLPANRDRAAGGLPLDALSPLAKVSRLVASRREEHASVARIAESGEVLYRMEVPPRLLRTVGKGLLKPMAVQSRPERRVRQLGRQPRPTWQSPRRAFVPVRQPPPEPAVPPSELAAAGPR